LSDSLAFIARIIRVASAAAAILVFLSFAAFAYDEIKAGSETSQAAINSDVRVEKDPALINVPDPDAKLEAARQKDHSGARELIDDANDALVSPFKSLTDETDDIWQQRLITTGLGLLLYGGLMLLIANYLPKKRSRRVSSVYEIPPDFRKR
jgi:hypothetical protein